MVLGEFLPKTKKEIPSQEGTFRCPLDQMTFDSKAELDRHYRRAHLGEANLTNIG